jgi:hypothetical protein
VFWSLAGGPPCPLLFPDTVVLNVGTISQWWRCEGGVLVAIPEERTDFEAIKRAFQKISGADLKDKSAVLCNRRSMSAEGAKVK